MLKSIPAEYLGFHYIVSRMRELKLDRNVLGKFAEKYSSEGSLPPLWCIPTEILFGGKNMEAEIVEHILSHTDAVPVIIRHFLGKFLIIPEIFKDLKNAWKIVAISWLLKAPMRYRFLVSLFAISLNYELRSNRRRRIEDSSIS